MPADYEILASVHDELGLGDYGRSVTPALIDFAQRHDWMGRQIVDLGCGSGEGASWLAQRGYIVTGIDNSQAMLTLARQRSGSSVSWQLQNLHQMNAISEQDMALAVDVMHEINGLRFLERIFQQVASVLKTDRLFIFDIYTIEGLVVRNQDDVSIAYESDDTLIVTRNDFDYERQVQVRDYTIFRRQNDSSWQRQDARRELRAYPVQGIVALVQRSGFEVKHVLNENLQPHVHNDSAQRVFIVAQKS